MKRKSTIFLLIVLMNMVGVNAFAAFDTSTKVQVGNLYYYLDNSNHLAEVTSMPSGKYSGDIVIPASFTYNNISYSVTSIGQSAFFTCQGMTSVTIPNGVTSIAQQAFAGCTGLTGNLEIPSSVTSIDQAALLGCGTSLTSIVVSSGNTKYDSRDNCNAIIETATNKLICGFKNTVIPNSVTSIGVNAFSGCGSLTSAVIPNSVTSIGDYAFYNCSGLTSVVIPNSVTSIGNGAFFGCTGLTSVTIPNSVTSIGNSAFQKCSSLTSVSIPNSVTSIGQSVFEGCSGLTSVEIPNSVTSIGDGAFFQCSGLTSVEIPNSVTSIGHAAFFQCSGLTSVEIGYSVTSIGVNAFYNCSGLTSVVIPNSVTSIGNAAFSGCTGLTSMVIPNSVKSIGERAFRDCSGLTSVTIGNNVTSIGDQTFYNCSGLTSVMIEKETPLNISSSTFSNRANATLYVPEGCVSAYQNAQYWQDFKFIEEIPASAPNIIDFADSNVKSICVSHWDTDGDEELSLDEAAAVTELSDYFKNNANITSFDELAYFTGLTSIGSYAFFNCTGLTSVTIPNSVTSIGEGAFSSSGLTSVTIPNSVTSIGDYAFNGCEFLTSVTIPNSVISIGDAAFYGCAALASITIPNSVTSIGEYAFSNCSSLTSLEIPNNVTSIGDQTFYNCSGLTSITIPNSVTSIGDYAFFNCSGLTLIEIPNSVTSIGSEAFCGCSGLISMVVSSGNTNYDSRGNCNAIIETTTNTLIYGCKKTVIPIGVTSIGYGAFYGCSGLTSVEIPNSVTSIGDYAFRGCSGLTSVTIPNSVTSIGNYAFYNCSGLTEVTVEIDTPLTISWSVFSNRANATLYVPSGCKAAYEGAPYWQDFKEIIEMAPSETSGDLNSDGTVSITDVVLIIDVMAGIITDAYQVAAADVNGDGDVTITDCVAAIDLIAAQQGNSPLMAMAPSMQPVGDYISGNYQDGLLTVDLCNENRYTAFQMLVSVPAGMRIVKAKMNRERGEEHQVLVRSIGSGQYLVAGFSLDNEELTGNNGSLLTIMTEGECPGDIVVSDVEFATVDADAWHLAGITVNGSTTGIADMGTDSGQTVYDLQGHQLDAQILRPDRQQGSKRIVIVNGKKVMIK